MLLKYRQATEDDASKIKELASSNGKKIQELATAQKSAAKLKDFETARSISDQVKYYKSYEKALSCVRFILLDGLGDIPSPGEELLPLIALIDHQIFD